MRKRKGRCDEREQDGQHGKRRDRGRVGETGKAAIDHLLTPLVEPEGLTSKELFLIAGEADGICGCQGKMDGPSPTEHLRCDGQGGEEVISGMPPLPVRASGRRSG